MPSAVRPASAAPAGPRFGTLREHVPWAILAVAAVAGAGATFRNLTHLEFVARGRWWLGLAAALGYLSAYAYVLRKRLHFGRFRPLRPWYVAHAWLTAAGFVIALHHASFTLGGLLEGALLVGFGLAVASGLGLALVHEYFRRTMVGLEREHLLPEDIVDSLTRRAHEVADLKAASRPEVARLIEQQVIAPLSRGTVIWRLRRGYTAVEALRREVEAGLGLADLRAGERDVVERVLAAEIERKSLELQDLLNDFRNHSVTVHMLLSSAVLGLLLLHVLVVAYY